jgi:hypothetical protein
VNTAAVSLLTAPGMLVALLALAAAALEGERLWTRARRQRPAAPGAMAYALDGLAVIGVVLFLVGLVLLLVQVVGAGFGWVGRQADSNPLLLGLAVVLVGGVAAAVFWLRRPARAAAPAPAAMVASVEAVVPAENTSRLAVSPVQNTALAGPNLRAHAVEQAGPVDNPLPPVSMYEQRRKAGPVAHPESFLHIRSEKAPVAPEKPKRSALVLTMLVVIVVAGLVGGALVFRQQLTGLIVETSATTAPPAVVISTAATSAPDASVAAVVPTAAAGLQLPTMRVKSDSLNMRAGPGTTQDVIVVLSKGDSVSLLGETSDVDGTTWVRVRARDADGWVSQKLLE